MTYKESFMTIWTGMRQLFDCLMVTLLILLRDSVRYAARHYLAVLLLLLSLSYTVKAMITAKAERDSANIDRYRLEQSCDSLRLLMGK